MKHILLLLFSFGFVCWALAQPGFLDYSFGDSGKVATPAVAGHYYASSLQKDGKVLSAGDSSSTIMMVLRHLHNGEVDSSFGVKGVRTIDLPAYQYETITAIAVLPDGKILVTGYAYNYQQQIYLSDLVMVRLTPNGELDHSFGDNGIRTYDYGYQEEADHMMIQPDGKILVSGQIWKDYDQLKRNILLTRFLPDGAIDSNFGTNGLKLDGELDAINSGLGLQSDGKIIVTIKYPYTSTPYFVLVRYNTNGTTDISFGDHGYVRTDFPKSNESINNIAIQDDDKIVVVGKGGFSNFGVGAKMIVVRYNPDGTLDQGFGDGGATYIKFDTDAEANSVAIQKNGKIVFTGDTYKEFNPVFFHTAIARVNPDGSIDSSFGINGKQQIEDLGNINRSTSALLQEDGKILSLGVREDIIGSYIILRLFGDPAHPLYTKIRKWIKNHILNFEDTNPNATYYVIEQSKNGVSGFIPVTKITATATTATYNYPLAATQDDNAYYRIKAVDKSGSASYSNVIADNQSSIINSKSSILKIFPNPAKNSITIQSAKAVTVRLQNSNGLVLATQKINGSGSMDISKLQAGIYYIIDTGTGTSYKVVKE